MKIEENALIDNSLRIQSRCKYLVRIQNIEDLNKIHDLIKSNKKYFIKGEGTNIIPPTFYDGLILKSELKHINLKKNILSVGSAYNWTDLVKFCIKNDINGFENLIDIPGSVGASPIQNIGAYGVEVSLLIESIDCYCLTEFKKINLTNSECDFVYRNSSLKNSKRLIYNINFITNKDSDISINYQTIKDYLKGNNIKANTTADVANIISQIRSKALPNPNIINNVGSFFKNPIVDIDSI